MFNLHRVFALWAVAVLFLSSARWAHAQTTPTTSGVTVNVPNTGVTRDHQDYAGKVLVTQINYKDCLNEDFFTFTVNLSAGYANYGLEVWAGTGCETQTNRNTATATCWQVADPLQPTSIIVNDLKVPIRRLLFGRTGGRNADDNGNSGGTGGGDATGGNGGGSATAGGSTNGGGGSGGSSDSSNGTVSECTTTSAGLAPQTLVIYFLMLDSNGTVGGQFQYKVTFKLNAPPPPDGVEAHIGENMAPITWNTPSDSGDQNIDGYQLYCDPAPGQSGLEESGIDWDPNILPPGCAKSSVLIEGARQRLLFGGDAFNHPLQIADPGVPSLADGDRAQAVSTRREVIALARAESLTVLGAHLPGALWPGHADADVR